MPSPQEFAESYRKAAAKELGKLDWTADDRRLSTLINEELAEGFRETAGRQMSNFGALTTEARSGGSGEIEIYGAVFSQNPGDPRKALYTLGSLRVLSIQRQRRFETMAQKAAMGLLGARRYAKLLARKAIAIAAKAEARKILEGALPAPRGWLAAEEAQALGRASKPGKRPPPAARL